MTTTKKTTKKTTKSTRSKTRASTKPKATPQSKSSTSPVRKTSQSALKLIDDAAGLLRKTVTSGADVAEKAHEDAQKKAHSMLAKAHGLLGGALDKSTSTLQGLIGKPRRN